MRRFGSKHRRELEEARRRAEAARQAAIARQRAIDEGMRNEVEANIAKGCGRGPRSPCRHRRRDGSEDRTHLHGR
jgi:hypothetical protein